MFIEWNVKQIREMLLERQKKKYDAIIAITGDRGDGKSTLLWKILHPVDKREIVIEGRTYEGKAFNPWEDVIYSRKEVMKKMERVKFGNIMDDEAIRTAYKRKFYDADQQLLIQMLNMYRDNFNIYGMAIPHFYDLDRDLRDLIKIHINVIRRGVGVIHIARKTMYSTDKWDTSYNKKLEESWGERKAKNKNFKIPYDKLTTYCGYIYFNALNPVQQALYDEIKETKRKEIYDEEISVEAGLDRETNFYKQLLIRVKNFTMTPEMLNEVCQISGKSLSLVRIKLNQMLRDGGSEETLAYYLDVKKRKVILKDVAVDSRFGYVQRG